MIWKRFCYDFNWYGKGSIILKKLIKKDTMTRIVLTIILTIVSLNINAQGYNSDRVAFTNFLVRMYNNAPFDGVRAVEDYDDIYLISVVALDKAKYKTESAMNRVASVKAMSQASRFFNGSNITSDLIIRTNEKSDGSTDTEVIETIREHSVGYVKSMEQLTNFTRKDGLKVFIFMTPNIKQSK